MSRLVLDPPTIGLGPTRTFLFTDIERSTELWARDTTEMSAALREHDRIVRESLDRAGGTFYKHLGDGICAHFDTPTAAASAAIAVQTEVTARRSGLLAPLRIRMGIHTCEVEERDGEFFGPGLSAAARIMDAASAGQIALSGVSAALLEIAALPAAALVDMGEYELRGFAGAARLFLLEHTGIEPVGRALRISARRRDNLPIMTTALIGRETELDQVCALLAAQRMVTLVGVGGVGKTRIAIEVASRMSEQFRHGTWLCELGVISDPSRALAAISSSLSLPQTLGTDAAEAAEAVADQLRGRELLLVIDNCEHVLAVVARLCDMFLSRCPSLTILATSREPVRVPGEMVWPIEPLAAHDGAGMSAAELERLPAVQLLLDRVRAAHPTFRYDDGDLVALAQLCHRLDGLPLALELAAARLATFSPAELTARLDERFQLLTGLRTRTPRHQTLQATVEWSYGLLTADEQRLFRGLSIFAGGFDTASAAEVVGDGHGAGLIAGLVDKSMLYADRDQAGRFRMHETLRAFGRQQLEASAEEADTVARYIDYWTAWAAAADAGLRGPDEVRWAGAVDTDFTNVRHTFTRLVRGGDTARAMELVTRTFLYALWRMRYEQGEWAAAALSLEGAADHPLWGEVTANTAYAAWARGDVVGATRITQQALAREQLEQLSPSVLLRNAAASTALYAGDLDAVDRYQKEWLDLAEAAGDDHERARALFTTAIARAARGDDGGAGEAAEEILAIGHGIANPTILAYGYHALAQAVRPTRIDQAVEYYSASAETARTVRNRLQEGLALRELASLHCQMGDPRAGFCTFRDVVRHWYRAGDWANQWLTFRKLGRALARFGHDEEADLVNLAVREHERRAARNLPAPVTEAMTPGERLYSEVNHMLERLAG